MCAHTNNLPLELPSNYTLHGLYRKQQKIVIPPPILFTRDKLENPIEDYGKWS
jgi:hypothetical protein